MTFFLVPFLVYVLDRITKVLVVKNIVQDQSVALIPNIFHITLVYNNGTAFGLFKDQNTPLLWLSLAVIIFIISYIWKKGRDTSWSISLSLGLILGGALGNLTDRIRLGYIIDFIDFRIWPVFNIADSAITIGLIILAWKILTKRCIQSS